MKIIAEMAWGHDGNLSQAIDLMYAAKKAGADMLSIHTYIF
jgi:pseudaminic acid synthase/N,N'-diacetyllegionaminate synthase